MALRQNRQCAFCGRRQYLDPHHIKRVTNGGPTKDWNLAGLCRPCHKFLDPIYNASPATNLILILQVVSPESRLIAAASKVLFNVFLRSRLDSTRYVSLSPHLLVDRWSERHQSARGNMSASGPEGSQHAA